jgi:hypothetical protein
MTWPLARSARHLTHPEWRVVAEACCAAPVASLAVRLLPLDRAVGLFSSRSPSPSVASCVVQPERIAALVDRVLSCSSARCLAKALVLQWMLGRRGIASEVRIGVRRGDGPLRAHAWVERRGQVLIGQGCETYVPLWRGSAPRRRTGVAA